MSTQVRAATAADYTSKALLRASREASPMFEVRAIPNPLGWWGPSRPLLGLSDSRSLVSSLNGRYTRDGLGSRSVESCEKEPMRTRAGSGYHTTCLEYRYIFQVPEGVLILGISP